MNKVLVTGIVTAGISLCETSIEEANLNDNNMMMVKTRLLSQKIVNTNQDTTATLLLSVEMSLKSQRKLLSQQITAVHSSEYPDKRVMYYTKQGKGLEHEKANSIHFN